MKLATWNINSIRIRLDAVCDWIKRVEPDILCLQETKVIDDDFPSDEFQLMGYAVAMAGQPGYNGVAIASRHPMKDIRVGFVGDRPDADRRLISATINGVRIFSAYAPNGQAVGSPTFTEKLEWFSRMRAHLDALSEEMPVAVCGDLNVAADERDVYAPELFRGKLHFHPDEHRALAHLKQYGLHDAFRKFHEEGSLYSWWDYRAGSFKKNQGLRIDYVLVTESVLKRCTRAWMDPQPRGREKPSDHIPVIIEFE